MGAIGLNGEKRSSGRFSSTEKYGFANVKLKETIEIFGTNYSLPKAKFIENFAKLPSSEDKMAAYAAELFDVYEDGEIHREVFEGFIGELARDAVDMTTV